MRLAAIKLFSGWLLAWLLAALPAFANIPSGGDGTGPNVTLTTSGNYVTLSNGVVTAKIQISTAQILEVWYNGIQVTDGGTAANNAFYWQGNSGSADTLATVVNPATNGGSSAVIQLFDSYTNNSANANAYRYFAMFRGSPGLYAGEVMAHGPNMPAGGADIPSLAGKLGGGIFNWLAQDTGRNKLMQSTSDSSQGGVNNSPKEVTLITSGQLAGQFDCKYDFAGELGALGCTGWCSTGLATNLGIWLVHPSDEYFTCGPKHTEILAQMMMLNSTFVGVHYGFHDDDNLATNENWAKVAGPFLIYLNKVSAGITNPQTALYADVLAQTAAERGAWPYSWFTDTNYVKASGRGMVTGKIIIADSGNPNASASNLWVGLQQQPATTTVPAPTDFQQWGKCYQYWTKSDGNGNFAFTNVVAGTNFTLFAFGPGAIGLFESQPLTGGTTPFSISTPASPFSVTVTAGATNSLGNVTWSPPRVGATVWEIGVPDRDTTEFRHGDDYWHGDMGNATNWAVNWMPWQNFNSDFPSGVNYNVGQSHWDKDWDYSHGSDLDPITGNLGTSTWTVNFNLPSAPTNGAAASIYFGIAASYQGPVIVKVNGTDIAGSTGFNPPYSDTGTADQAMIRMGSHGMASDYRINFSSTLLHAGTNTITLNMRKGGYFSNMTMYDYIRLELAGYIPPLPANLSASAGNGLVSLWWPSAPGATAYTVLRSTTSGGGYTAIATNVIGPTSGSVNDTAAFNDTNVVNGNSYYYVVRSTNPNGSSTNSVQAAGTPSAATPTPPGTPTNLTATAGNNFVALKWNVSSGAARYIVQRTVLTIGAVTTYMPGGINPYATINSFVTGTNYTDTALDNNVAYSYLVSAANANGQSANSIAVNATPLPSLPIPPTGLSVSVITNQVTFFWSAVSNASGYVVSRATAIAGPYAIVDNPEPLTSSVDIGLSYNTTYYYKVAAANLAGVSTNSAPIAATTTPGAPASITAVPGNMQAALFWAASPGATNYFLQRSTNNGGPYATILSTPNTSYVNLGLTNGTTYYYVVYCVGPAGTSPLSAQAGVTPFAGTGIYWINSITASAQGWNVNTNWSNLTAFPNATQITAVVNSGISANQTINLNQGITIGELDIGTAGGAGTFNVTGNGGTLTFDANPADATLMQLATSKGDTLSAPMTINGGLVILNQSTNNAFTLAGTIAGATNGLTLNGKIILTGTNTFSGGTDLNPGALALPGSANANTGCWGSGPVNFLGGTLQIYGYGNTTGTFGGMTNTLNVPDGQSGTLLLPGRFGYYSPFTSALTGSGTLNITVDYIRDRIGGDWSNFAGQINVTTRTGSGDFEIYNNKGYGTAAVYLTGGARFGCMYNSTQMIDVGELAGDAGTIFGTCDETAGTQTWRVGGRNTDAIFAGTIVNGANAASVIKVGSGIWTLTGANTYTGNTTVSNGTLLVANTSGSGTGFGTVTVNFSGTLGGNGVVSGATTVNSGGTLAPGALAGGAATIGTLTFSNSLKLAVGCTNIFEISKSPLTNDAAKIFGALTNGGTLLVNNVGATALTNGDSFKLFSAASYNGGFAGVVLPALASGLAWNTNALATNGILSVLALKSPALSGAILGSTNLAVTISGGTTNWPFILLTATNLAGTWTPAATNQFDAAGNFYLVLTNAVNPARQQSFYKVQLP
jgi:rhamnogalacturonan endolyase